LVEIIGPRLDEIGVIIAAYRSYNIALPEHATGSQILHDGSRRFGPHKLRDLTAQREPSWPEYLFASCPDVDISLSNAAKIDVSASVIAHSIFL
jgi:hypothetical protein